MPSWISSQQAVLELQTVGRIKCQIDMSEWKAQYTTVTSFLVSKFHAQNVTTPRKKRKEERDDNASETEVGQNGNFQPYTPKCITFSFLNYGFHWWGFQREERGPYHANKMDTNAAPLRFVKCIGQELTEDTWIEDRLRVELPNILTQLRTRDPLGQCQLADAGEYVLRVLQIVSGFANALAYGDFVHEHATSRLQALLEEDDGSAIDYLDGKHEALKNIANQLNTAANTCLKVWEESPVPITDLSSDIDSQPPSFFTPVSPLAPSPYETVNRHPTSHHSSASPGNQMDDTMDQSPDSGTGSTAVPSLEHLSSRGTGNYTCPHGKSCSKGGVLADGQLRVFIRNSEFTAHMQRHEKPFRCDLPGCTNVKGFARKDQLERHKKIVKHNQAGDWINRMSSR